MKNNPYTTLKYSVFCVSVLLSSIVYGGVLPQMNETVGLDARQIELPKLLNTIFSTANLPVVIAPDVQGRLSGTWNVSASSFLDELRASQSLVYYYDGHVAYVYKNSAVAVSVSPISSALQKQVISSVQAMGLSDPLNTVKAMGQAGLVVAGVPRFVEQTEQIISAVKSNRQSQPRKQSKPKKYKTKQGENIPVSERLYYLKHAWAQDTTVQVNGSSVRMKGVASILSEIINSQPIWLNTSGNGNNVNATGYSATKLQPLAGSNTPEVNGVPLLPVSGGGASYSGNAADGSIAAKIVPIVRLNAVLIRDRTDRLDAYQQIIDSLDIEQKMLEIEATIIDIDSTVSRELGVNLSFSDENGSAISSLSRSAAGFSDEQVAGNSLAGGVLSLAGGPQTELFLARIRALEKTGNAEIISRPRVVTLSNVEAVLDSSETFYVRVTGAEDASLFEISTGTVLRVTPHVYINDGQWQIKLLVNVQDGATSSQTVDEIPVVGTTNINTQAVVMSGDSLLIGGMAREITRKNKTQVPVIGDIPLVGRLFRSTSTNTQKVERLFLLSPKILDLYNRPAGTTAALAYNAMDNQQPIESKSTEYRGVVVHYADTDDANAVVSATDKLLDPSFGKWNRVEFKR